METLILLDFKIMIANCLIGKHSNCQREKKRKSTSQAGSDNTLAHLPEYQVFRQQCMYCKRKEVLYQKE